MEVPEIYDGIIDIKTVCRDPRRSEETRLNSSHTVISYAVFCLKKKKKRKKTKNKKKKKEKTKKTASITKDKDKRNNTQLTSTNNN